MARKHLAKFCTIILLFSWWLYIVVMVTTTVVDTKIPNNFEFPPPPMTLWFLSSTTGVSFLLSESDYRINENEVFIPLVVTRTERLATNVTLRITPLNLTQANTSDFYRPLDFPPIPQTDMNIPITAKSEILM